MEEFIGKLWHNWITKAAGGTYPEATVKLAEVEKTAGILFRAFGGDPGLKVAAATTESHGARRRWLERLAGSNEKAALAKRDAETLRLPPIPVALPQSRQALSVLKTLHPRTVAGSVSPALARCLRSCFFRTWLPMARPVLARNSGSTAWGARPWASSAQTPR